jgi:hypothetical protein
MEGDLAAAKQLTCNDTCRGNNTCPFPNHPLEQHIRQQQNRKNLDDVTLRDIRDDIIRAAMKA